MKKESFKPWLLLTWYSWPVTAWVWMSSGGFYVRKVWGKGVSDIVHWSREHFIWGTLTPLEGAGHLIRASDGWILVKPGRTHSSWAENCPGLSADQNLDKLPKLIELQHCTVYKLQTALCALILGVSVLPGAQQPHDNSTVLVVSVVAGMVGAICLTLVAFIVYQMHKSKISLSKTILYPQGWQNVKTASPGFCCVASLI